MSLRLEDRDRVAEFSAWHGALQFTNRAMRAIDEALSAAHDISITEFDVLITLFDARDGRLRMTELAERVVLAPSGITNPRDAARAQGLVHRVIDPGDRRSFFAELTRSGQRRLRESRATHNEVIRARLTRRLTAKELATMGALFKAIEVSAAEED